MLLSSLNLDYAKNSVILFPSSYHPLLCFPSSWCSYVIHTLDHYIYHLYTWHSYTPHCYILVHHPYMSHSYICTYLGSLHSCSYCKHDTCTYHFSSSLRLTPIKDTTHPYYSLSLINSIKWTNIMTITSLPSWKKTFCHLMSYKITKSSWWIMNSCCRSLWCRRSLPILSSSPSISFKLLPTMFHCQFGVLWWSIRISVC